MSSRDSCQKLKEQFQLRAKKLTKREGKKSSVKIGDVREVLGLMADMVFENPEREMNFLLKLGKKRAARK